MGRGAVRCNRPRCQMVFLCLLRRMTPYELTDIIINVKYLHTRPIPTLLYCPLVLQFELRLITSIITTMKNYASLRSVQTPPLSLEIQRQSPQKMGLLLQIPQLASPQSILGRGSGERDKEQDSTELLLTERTGGKSENHPAKQSKGSNIKTFLRIRPTNNPSALLQLHPPQIVTHERSIFKFDSIFEAGTQQERVFAQAGREATSTFLQGYNATIFAYGSTGSGKTYTMFGNDDGLVPSVVKEIFGRLPTGAKLSSSMIQIYRENLIDLLQSGGAQLKIKDAANNSCIVQNLSQHAIATQAEALALIKRGNILKKMRETDLNQCSSRSHVVFTLVMERADSEGRTMECKFNLVDLAGSEKVGKSKVQGEGLEQAKKINLSLSCLGNTISALVRGSEHVPFRQSKLTRILKESLMGSSLTRLIVTCSLSEEALEDTISSMKFAQRAQKVQTQAEKAYSRGKQDRVRLLQGAIDRLEADSAKISQLLNRQRCDCANCAQIRSILSKKPALPIFNFHPMALPQPYKSPKQAERNYYSNASLEKGKSFSFLKTNYQTWHDNSAQNRIKVDLTVENDRLRQDKAQLQGRLRILQQKPAEKDREKEKGRKVIRLGQRGSKSNKENQMSIANGADRQKISKQQQKRQPRPPILVESEPSCIKEQEHDCQQTLELITSAISKLEAACIDYRNTVYPIHIDILNSQIALLQAKLTPQLLPPQMDNPLKISNLLINLQKKMCSYVDSVGDIIPRLFQGTRCDMQGRNESSEILGEKLREMSDIKWSFKQFYDQPQQLRAITELLRPLSSRPIRDKTLNISGVTLLNGQNQFLDIDPATFHPFLHPSPINQ